MTGKRVKYAMVKASVNSWTRSSLHSEDFETRLNATQNLHALAKQAVNDFKKTGYKIPDWFMPKAVAWASETVDKDNPTVARSAADILLLAAQVPGKHLKKITGMAKLGLNHKDSYVKLCSASSLREAAQHSGRHLNGVLEEASKAIENNSMNAELRADCAKALANIAKHGDKHAGNVVLGLLKYAGTLDNLNERNLVQKRYVDDGYEIIREGFNNLGSEKLHKIVKRLPEEEKKQMESVLGMLRELKIKEAREY
ncbi:hypothetical protein H0N96_03630 [Candidatus Micrarchaeota archaeon]|nr:hypothetical protein [Candidatus Micrarchaeota archaeon]